MFTKHHTPFSKPNRKTWVIESRNPIPGIEFPLFYQIHATCDSCGNGQWWLWLWSSLCNGFLDICLYVNVITHCIYLSSFFPFSSLFYSLLFGCIRIHIKKENTKNSCLPLFLSPSSSISHRCKRFSPSFTII